MSKRKRIRRKERERCAKICEAVAAGYKADMTRETINDFLAAKMCANAIRHKAFR